MIEPERADAAGQKAFEMYLEFPAGSHPIVWEDLSDDIKNNWKLLAARTVEEYFTSRPGGPCSHEEYFDTGRCAEMACSNYVEKHRAPFRQDVPLRESGNDNSAISAIHHPADFG
jgi:hypothetical protein